MNTTLHLSPVQEYRLEKARISELCRKLSRKLSTIEPFTDKYNEVYAKYVYLQDYRSELVTTIQLATRMERYGF